jgi:hypothetical protein
MDTAGEAEEITAEHPGTAKEMPEFSTGVMEIARELTALEHKPTTSRSLIVPGIAASGAAKRTIETARGVVGGKKVQGAVEIDAMETVREMESAGSMEIAGELAGIQELGLPGREPALPWSYGDCKITALVRDPYWLFVYWEINDAKREEIASRYGSKAWDGARPVLRVYDTTNLYYFDSRHYVEIAINDYANNWYICTGQPNRTFCIELGRVRPDGSFIFVARSNFVSTPRDQLSEVIDEEWLLPEAYAARLHQRIGGGRAPSSPGLMPPGAYISSPGVPGPGAQISSPIKW